MAVHTSSLGRISRVLIGKKTNSRDALEVEVLHELRLTIPLLLASHRPAADVSADVCREFEYHNVLRLWEVLWSRYLSDHFHLYVCVAVLKRHRRKIMDEQVRLRSVLAFCSSFVVLFFLANRALFLLAFCAPCLLSPQRALFLLAFRGFLVTRLL